MRNNSAARAAAAAARTTRAARAAAGRPEPALGVFNTHLKGSQKQRVKDLILSLTWVRTGGEIDVRVVDAVKAWCEE